MSDANEFGALDATFRHVWALGRRQLLKGAGMLAAALPLLLLPRRARSATCTSTRTVPVEGPYFFGEAEERSVTGKQLVVSGVVRAADSCEVIAGARIVRWHSNKTGLYEDYYRALMVTDAQGKYQLETIIPGIYAGLRRHIHFHVSAEGYQDLITQIIWDNSALPPALNAFDFALERKR